MDRSEGKHLIGDPVEMAIPEGGKGFRFPNAPYGPKMTRFFVNRFRMIAIMMGISFAVAMVIAAPIMLLTIFLLPVFIVGYLFMILLIMGISFPLAIALTRAKIKDLERNVVVLGGKGIHVMSKYAIGSPTVVLDIPYANIESAVIGGKDLWSYLKERSARSFMFLNGVPQPRPADLFTIFSGGEDLIVIRLMNPIRIDRLIPPSGFQVPRQRSYHVRELVVDIDPRRQGQFMELIIERIESGRDR
ncbi:MAG: hypothetical protein QCI82_10670 [Candidatus Thermoplasmatota archaeon]|nr:hypothetical protein [Candidatus Thermoplasmatota archaeon]